MGAINECEPSSLREHVVDEPASIIEGPPHDAIVFDRNRIRLDPGLEFVIGRVFDANELLALLADQQVRYVPGIELESGIRIC